MSQQSVPPPITTQLTDYLDTKIQQLKHNYKLYKHVTKKQYNNNQLSQLWSHSIYNINQCFLTTQGCIATGVGYGTGLLTYITCTQFIHTLHCITRISSAMKYTATVSGLITVPLCSIIAAHTMCYTSARFIEQYNHASNKQYVNYPFSTKPYTSYYNYIRQQYDKLWLYNNDNSRVFDYSIIQRSFNSNYNNTSILDKLSNYISTYNNSDNIRYINVSTLVYGVTGLLSYRLLGGRLRYTAPSDLYKVGTYMRVTLPALRGSEYADKAQKQLLQQYGRKWGCHHCGVRWGRYLSKISDRRYLGGYIGDHIPPNKYSTALTKQLFLPQCTTCSSKQSSSVRDDKRRLVLPRSLRLYNMFLPLPICGLLIVPIVYAVHSEVQDIKEPTLRSVAKTLLFDK